MFHKIFLFKACVWPLWLWNYFLDSPLENLSGLKNSLETVRMTMMSFQNLETRTMLIFQNGWAGYGKLPRSWDDHSDFQTAKLANSELFSFHKSWDDHNDVHNSWDDNSKLPGTLRTIESFLNYKIQVAKISTMHFIIQFSTWIRHPPPHHWHAKCILAYIQKFMLKRTVASIWIWPNMV